MPAIRPFRALRYDPDAVGDLAAVVCPPYDIVGPGEHATLLARHSRNAIRLDLPVGEPDDAPEDRYRRAARTLALWRTDGTLRKDPRPSVYVYEQAYRVPGTGEDRTQRGFFARLRLEPFGPGGGVVPHERTLSEPKEDRYRLLRATGANISPAVGIHEDAHGRAAALLATLVEAEPAVDVHDDDGARHRLWVVQGDLAGVAELIAAASAGPITIADGHHRYETALRYRDERRMTRSCEEDPAFDYTLMLLLSTAAPLTILPTHRVVRELGEAGVERLLAGLADLFVVHPAGSLAELAAEFGPGGAGGSGRLGLVTRGGIVVLEARRGQFEPDLPPGGEALHRLDVTLLGVVLERLCGIDAAAIAEGERVGYTRSAAEANERVADRTDGADAAFLMAPTPLHDVLAVARDGDLMPQKSTYFYPKALTGLVINPHEW